VSWPAQNGMIVQNQGHRPPVGALMRRQPPPMRGSMCRKPEWKMKLHGNG
jgi:hypothetical protein